MLLHLIETGNKCWPCICVLLAFPFCPVSSLSGINTNLLSRVGKVIASPFRERERAGGGGRGESEKELLIKLCCSICSISEGSSPGPLVENCQTHLPCLLMSHSFILT